VHTCVHACVCVFKGIVEGREERKETHTYRTLKFRICFGDYKNSKFNL
jgi:hypothetical protein